MQFGVVYPQTELDSDPIKIRDYVQAVEGMGYQYVLAYDHVMGANPERPGGWSGPYTYQSRFMEPLVLFAYMAGITHKLGFATGVIILPQRQTALVAKQATVLDILCGGRLRLGVGIGWNEVEYIALGEEFRSRGKRVVEQIRLMRKIWTQELVTFEGMWHSIPDAGINPLPVQRPIPIWMGGQAEVVLERAARLADGWMPASLTIEKAQPFLDKIYDALERVGRDRSAFGIEARIPYSSENPREMMSTVAGWQNTATHLSINTMGCGLIDLEHHLQALSRFASEIGIQTSGSAGG